MEKTKTLYRSKFIKFNSKPTQMTGVFIITFMTEFCFSGWNGKNSVHFDNNVMRNHLLKCMEGKQFSPFPKIKPVKSKVTLNLKNTSVNLSIKKEWKAKCDLPNLFEDMVSCDKCSTWYHFGCASNGTLVNFQASFYLQQLKQCLMNNMCY